MSLNYLVFIWLSCVSVQAWAQARIALVIGNADYQNQALANPAHDAEDIANVLTKVGFEVTLLRDATAIQMQTALNHFGKKLHKDSVNLFYYAGHGVQYQGNNYLIPLQSLDKVKKASDLPAQTLNVSQLLTLMAASDSSMNIIILDACRNNPFKLTDTLEQGLARMSGAAKTLIAYSTAPGKLALDGEYRNSPYTQQLLRHIPKPDVPIEFMLKEVGGNVHLLTQGLQSPWYESAIDKDFYFVEAFVKIKKEMAAELDAEMNQMLGKKNLPQRDHVLGSWQWRDDKQTFFDNNRGVYYRSGQLCYRFRYQLKDQVLHKWADKKHACGAKESLFKVDIRPDSLKIEHIESGYISHWQLLDN